MNHRGRPTHHLLAPNSDGVWMVNGVVMGAYMTVAALIAALHTTSSTWPAALVTGIPPTGLDAASLEALESDDAVPDMTHVPSMAAYMHNAMTRDEAERTSIHHTTSHPNHIPQVCCERAVVATVCSLCVWWPAPRPSTWCGRATAACVCGGRCARAAM